MYIHLLYLYCELKAYQTYGSFWAIGAFNYQ